jgi:hypothetical protein
MALFEPLNERNRHHTLSDFAPSPSQSKFSGRRPRRIRIDKGATPAPWAVAVRAPQSATPPPRRPRVAKNFRRPMGLAMCGPSGWGVIHAMEE